MLCRRPKVEIGGWYKTEMGRIYKVVDIRIESYIHVVYIKARDSEKVFPRSYGACAEDTLLTQLEIELL
jgi:hypothetical protein